MLKYSVAYGASAAAFLAIDFIWLSIASRLIYRPLLGDLLAETPKLSIAAAFYLVYAVGIVVFAVMPAVAAKSLATALMLGALLGLVAYGTYDITNLATIRGWPATVSIIDIIWGTMLTAVSAGAGYLAVRTFLSSA